MKSEDKKLVVRYWDDNAAYEDMSMYATVHKLDGAVIFIEPFAIMTDNEGVVYRHYYNREKVNHSDVEILEMSEF